MLPPGTKIGPYEVLGELGRGGMGVVLRARRPDLQRDFALKVILPGKDATPEALERFRREARAAARLAGHPGIVGVHDIGELDGKLYFAMDLVDGPSLDKLIDTEALTPRRTAMIAAKTARALHHAHVHGVLHRDIKPANILVTATDEVRITDFGLAQTQDSTAESARLTKAGAVLGTPAYLSPEQANGDPLDPRADIYSLGATLYEALAGEPPFSGDTVYTILAQIQRDEAPAPRARDPRVPRDLDTIVMKCIEKDRERRYPTALALAEDLERFLRNEPISARPTTFGYRLRKRIGRHPWAWVLGTAAALGVATTAGILGWVLIKGAITQRKLVDETRKKQLAEWANVIAGAYYDLSIKTMNEMQGLEDDYHGLKSAAEDVPMAVGDEPVDPVARWLGKIDRVTSNAMKRFDRVRLPQAWRGLAAFYAGREGGLAEVERAAADVAANLTEDPFPPLLLGRVSVAQLLRDLRLPAATRDGARVVPGPLVEPPDAATTRQRLIGTMQEGLKRAVWEKLHHTKEYREFALGAIAFAEARYAEAAAGLAGLGTEPILRSEAATLRGIAAYLSGEPDAAVAAFTVAIARKDDKDRNKAGKPNRAWPGAFFNRGTAHAAVALLREAQGGDPIEAVAAAIADFERAAERWAAAGRSADARLALERALTIAAPGSADATRLATARDALAK